MYSRDVVLDALRHAENMGVGLVIVRFHERLLEHVVADGGGLRDYSFSVHSGVGVEVYSGGGRGFYFTSDLSREGLKAAVERAYSMARVSRPSFKPSLVDGWRGSFRSGFRVDPFSVEPKVKVDMVLDVNRESSSREGVSSAVTRLGFEKDYRSVVTSEGVEAESLTILSGFSHTVVAKHAGTYERVGDSKSLVGGFETIESMDLRAFAEEVDGLALKAVTAKTAPPGSYEAVIDNDIVGVLIHEALGHASEGDHVVAGSSVISGKIGESIAGSEVTIVDEGLVEGGYPVYFDDEGVVKRKTLIVERGVLKSYLTSRAVAPEVGLELTGNGRAQGYSNEPIVRQTNYYIEAGGWSVEELFEGLNGVYLKGKGMVGGGQVDTSNGVFTFTVGPSYIVKNGEPLELVRGVAITGNILELLKNITGVGRDLKLETSVFGGCGKGGQMVRVGLGGPHVRVKRVIVGGT